jgi:hypothetical protein
MVCRLQSLERPAPPTPSRAAGLQAPVTAVPTPKAEDATQPPLMSPPVLGDIRANRRRSTEDVGETLVAVPPPLDTRRAPPKDRQRALMEESSKVGIAQSL